jgi:hypothetical protein
MAMLDELKRQVQFGIRRRSSEFLLNLFGWYERPFEQRVSKSDIVPSFHDYRVSVLDSHEHLENDLSGIEDDKTLDFDEFIRTLQTPSLLDQWAQSLPLWQILSDAIPRKRGVTSDQFSALNNLLQVRKIYFDVDFFEQVASLETVSLLTPSEIEIICEAFKYGLYDMILSKCHQLETSLRCMARRGRLSQSKASCKFQISVMNAGNIRDFHNGLSGRLGTQLICISSKKHNSYLIFFLKDFLLVHHEFSLLI